MKEFVTTLLHPYFDLTSAKARALNSPRSATSVICVLAVARVSSAELAQQQLTKIAVFVVFTTELHEARIAAPARAHHRCAVGGGFAVIFHLVRNVLI